MFPISQSAALTALFTKESLATRSVGNVDLQANKRIKASLFCKFLTSYHLTKASRFCSLSGLPSYGEMSPFG